MNFEKLITSLYEETDLSIRKYIPDKLAKLGNWNSTEHLGNILLNDNEPIDLRIECAESLGKQGDPKAVNILIQALETISIELIRTIIWSLGQIGSVDSIKVIFSYYDHENDFIRKWVVKSLGRMNSKVSLDKLLFLLYNNGEKNQLILNDTIRSIDMHFIHITNDFVNKLTDFLSYLYNKNPPIYLKTSILKLLNKLSEKYIFTDIINWENECTNLKENEKSLENLILSLLANKNHDKFILSLPISPSVIHALSIINKISELTLILENPNDYNSAIISAAIIHLPTTYHGNYLQYIDHADSDIKMAAYTYYAKRKEPFELIESYYHKSKLKNSIIKLFQYYPQAALDLINRILLQYDKVQRQSALFVINQWINNSEFYDRDRLILILMKVSINDPIWHIRRDARKILYKLNG